MSGILFAFVLVCISSGSVFAQEMMPEKVPVTVYYESLCPDSIRFITKQLVPTWMNMSNYMNLTLVPFGKANFTKNEAGQYEFNCHHGPKECTGNIAQACALNAYSSNDQVNFVNCVMSMTEGRNMSEVYPIKQCADSLSLTSIENCANGPDGAMALAELGNKTNELNPKLMSVPTVVFNNQYMQKDQDMAMTNFRSVLCSHIKGTKPMECDNKNSGISLKSTIYPIVAASILLIRM